MKLTGKVAYLVQALLTISSWGAMASDTELSFCAKESADLVGSPHLRLAGETFRRTVSAECKSEIIRRMTEYGLLGGFIPCEEEVCLLGAMDPESLVVTIAYPRRPDPEVSRPDFLKGLPVSWGPDTRYGPTLEFRARDCSFVRVGDISGSESRCGRPICVTIQSIRKPEIDRDDEPRALGPRKHVVDVFVSRDGKVLGFRGANGLAPSEQPLLALVQEITFDVPSGLTERFTLPPIVRLCLLFHQSNPASVNDSPHNNRLEVIEKCGTEERSWIREKGAWRTGGWQTRSTFGESCAH